MCFSVGIERNLSQLSKLFGASVDGKAFEGLKNLSEKYPKEFKVPSDDNRLYPHVFGPVLMNQKLASTGELVRVIKPMRYRVRPSDALEEVPSKFNLFNARLDSLESRKTWRPLFGTKHGLFPYKRFYEWVEAPQNEGGGKQLVSFHSNEHDYLMAPVLYDFYQEGEKSFFSFAIITTEPPPEVLEAGHDRCPVFIKPEYWQNWLNPQQHKTSELYDILQDPLRPYYSVTLEEEARKKAPDPQLSLFEGDS